MFLAHWEVVVCWQQNVKAKKKKKRQRAMSFFADGKVTTRLELLLL
jgi:hypothetical protein